MVDLISGKEREGMKARGRRRERRRQRAHLHICLETWKSAGEEGRIAAAKADIIIIIKNEEREDRKVCNKKRAGKGVLPGYDITGVVLSVSFQWTHSPKHGDLPRR